MRACTQAQELHTSSQLPLSSVHCPSHQLRPESAASVCALLLALVRSACVCNFGRARVSRTDSHVVDDLLEHIALLHTQLLVRTLSRCAKVLQGRGKLCNLSAWRLGLGHFSAVSVAPLRALPMLSSVALGRVYKHRALARTLKRALASVTWTFGGVSLSKQAICPQKPQVSSINKHAYRSTQRAKQTHRDLPRSPKCQTCARKPASQLKSALSLPSAISISCSGGCQRAHADAQTAASDAA